MAETKICTINMYFDKFEFNIYLYYLDNAQYTDL